MAENIIKVLSNNRDKICDLLELAGFLNVNPNGRNITFAFDNIGGSGSCSINPETLQYFRGSTGDNGRIFDAIMAKKRFNFQGALRWIEENLGMSQTEMDKKLSEIDKMWGGIFSRDIENYQTFTEGYMEKEMQFDPCISQMFLDDGISRLTQVYYDIKYDHISDRVVIPWKDENGDFVGWSARANFDLPANYSIKYLTSENFYKSRFLFGLYENKEYIKDKYCVVVESEKSVMQAFAFGFRNIVAVGSGSMSARQAKLLIEEFGVKSLIFMWDEGTKFLTYISQFDKLYPAYGDKVEFWYLKDYSLLPKYSKCSPTDMGKEIFESIFKTCIAYYQT